MSLRAQPSQGQVRIHFGMTMVKGQHLGPAFAYSQLFGTGHNDMSAFWAPYGGDVRLGVTFIRSYKHFQGLGKI